MLLKFLGWGWVIAGIWFLFNPEQLRSTLKKQSIKKLKNIFSGIAFILGILLLKAAWGVPGFLAKLVVLFGLGAIVKAIYLFKAKGADSLIEWFLALPRKTFRMWAVAQILIGAVILTV